MSGLDPIDSGTLYIDTKEITSQNHPHYPIVYLMHQSSDLRPHMTMEDNIIFPLQKLKIYQPEQYQELVTTLNINHLKNKYPSECSG